jgi:hypothetical protein
MPLAIALRSVPIVTTAPLVVLLIGRGAVGHHRSGRGHGLLPHLRGLPAGPETGAGAGDGGASTATRRAPLTRLIRVRIPAMLPAFFAAARMAVPASVLAVTVVEWLATGSGIGSLMALSASLSDYDVLWSSVVLVAVLSALGYVLVGCGGAAGAGASTRRSSWHDLRRAAFAIPGDITTPTGGYIYERRLLEGLRAQGRDVRHLQLGASFPDPTPEDMADAIAQLQAWSPTAR